MKKIIIFLFLCIMGGCTTTATRNLRQVVSWEKLQCGATYTEKKQNKSCVNVRRQILYSYESLGHHTRNQIRCMVSKNFNYKFLESKIRDKTLTFYNRSTKEGLIYFFAMSGYLKVTVISRQEDNSYAVSRYKYSGPFEEMVAIFQRGSIYMPYKFKKPTETSYTNEKALPLLYFNEGGFKLQ